MFICNIQDFYFNIHFIIPLGSSSVHQVGFIWFASALVFMSSFPIRSRPITFPYLFLFLNKIFFCKVYLLELQLFQLWCFWILVPSYFCQGLNLRTDWERSEWNVKVVVFT
jgi:hypothetical protein